MSKTKLVGSASTLERLLLLTCNYFYSNIQFVKLAPLRGVERWGLHNSKGPIVGYTVKFKASRFRLERVVE